MKFEGESLATLRLEIICESQKVWQMWKLKKNKY